MNHKSGRHKLPGGLAPSSNAGALNIMSDFPPCMLTDDLKITIMPKLGPGILTQVLPPLLMCISLMMCGPRYARRIRLAPLISPRLSHGGGRQALMGYDPLLSPSCMGLQFASTRLLYPTCFMSPRSHTLYFSLFHPVATSPSHPLSLLLVSSRPSC